MKLAELAQLARAELDGDGSVDIQAVTDLEHAHAQALVMVADHRALAAAEASRAGALLIGTQAPATAKPALRARNLRAAFARALMTLAPPARPAPGIHPTAVVAADAQLAADVTLGPNVVVASGASIGARTVIHPGTSIGARVRVGADCEVHPNVTVYPDGVIGDRVIIHGGSVIGSDGFGYAAEEGVHLKIPHLGRVVIEDDVEIGANTTVDRGTLGETRIGRGAKIDNLVQIAHNVVIGPGTIVVAQVGISGSVTMGEGVLVAGQPGIRDHTTIGAGARILGQAGVTKDVSPGATVSGYPARDHREALRIDAALSRLPELIERVRSLEARLDDLDPGRKP